MKKSIIGKKYIPCDNSWSVNVTQAGHSIRTLKYPYLAGTLAGLEPKECIVVSEPFKCLVKGTNLIEREMVMVNYDYNTYMVMYFDYCVK